MPKSLETRKWRDQRPKSAKPPSLVHGSFPAIASHAGLSHLPKSSFVVSWKWYLKWWVGPFPGVTQYKGSIYVIKLLFVILPLICLY